MRPRRALQVSYWKVAALMAFGAFPSGPLQLSRRNATFFIKYLGGGLQLYQSFGRTIPPSTGGKRFPNLQFWENNSPRPGG